jgi:predicted transcriptional regulator
MPTTRTIEVDAATAEELEARAATRGVSVGQMVADLIALDDPARIDDEIAELDRQWAAIEAGAETVPHDKVARWVETWGTPDFKPWHKR